MTKSQSGNEFGYVLGPNDTDGVLYDDYTLGLHADTLYDMDTDSNGDWYNLGTGLPYKNSVNTREQLGLTVSFDSESDIARADQHDDYEDGRPDIIAEWTRKTATGLADAAMSSIQQDKLSLPEAS